jgi:asparagine synthase (glutamine-hydrolysing)
MSAFAVILRWRGPAVDATAIEPLLEALRHRGGHGRSVSCGAAAVVGAEHVWTTPEDEGSLQPVTVGEPDIQLVFDGRVDNRAELLAALGLAPWARVSDPELVARAFGRWGAGLMARLVGPAALAIIDQRRRRAILCRDALGDRTVVYAEVPGGLVVASEEQAVLVHPEVSGDLDDETVARFLAFRAPRPGRTFFSAVREVPPGCVVTFDADGQRITRHWTPDEILADLETPDGGWVEAFRATLETAVACRLRATTPPTVLMSGGLDSTSVAAHAASLLGPGHRLHTVSWVFDELGVADERAFIEPMIEHHGLDPTLITGDELWPMRDRASWPCNPNLPYESIYRSLGRAAYAAVSSRGGSVLLTGEMGDQLYLHHAFWLHDLVRQRRVRAVAQEIGDAVRRRGWRGTIASMRPAVGRLIGARRSGGPPPWLTSHGADLAGFGARKQPEAGRRIESIIDPFATFGLAREITTAAGAGIDLRRPYRDRRVVELVMRMPAHLCSRGGFHKWILREAGCGLLPEPVRLRQHHSTLLPLFARGLVERRRGFIGRLLGAPSAPWRRFVRTDWLERHFRSEFPTDSAGSAAIWQCLCLQLWCRSFVKPASDRATPIIAISGSDLYNLESEYDSQASI